MGDIGPDIMGDIGPDIGPDMGDVVPGSPCAFLQNAEPPQSPTGDKSTQPGSTSSRNFCVWGSNCLTQIGKIAMCQITLHRPISKIAMRAPQHRRARMIALPGCFLPLPGCFLPLSLSRVVSTCPTGSHRILSLERVAQVQKFHRGNLARAPPTLAQV